MTELASKIDKLIRNVPDFPKPGIMFKDITPVIQNGAVFNEIIRAMAEKKPQRVICLDLGFVGNDQLKANAVQIFKTKEVVFKTV